MGILLVIFGRVYLKETHDVKYTVSGTLLSLLICALGLVPLYFFVTIKSEDFKVPFLMVWAGVTIIQYGFRSLIYGNFIQYGNKLLAPNTFLKSLFVVILAIAICFFTYYTIKKKVFNKDTNLLKFDLQSNLKGIFVLGVIGNIAYAFETVAGGVFYTFNQFFPAAVQQPIKLIAGLPIITIILLSISFLRNELNKKQVIIFWGLI